MAYTTGTATDHFDLLAKVHAFANLNGWDDVYWDGNSWVGKGTGEGGNEEILISLTVHEDSTNDAYGFSICGASAYRQGDINLEKSPNHCEPRGMALWSHAMDYWIIGDPRRIIIIAKVSTKFFSCYLGLLRPLATNQQEPYPLFIGGSHWENNLSWTSSEHESFWRASVNGYECRAVWTPGGRVYGQYEASTGWTSQYYFVQIYPWSDDPWSSTGEVWGGGTVIRPALVSWSQRDFSKYSKYQTAGQLDGVYYVPGLGLSAESIITIGGDSYLVIPSSALTGENDWAAIKLA